MIPLMSKLLTDQHYAGVLSERLSSVFEIAEAECSRIQLRESETAESAGQDVDFLWETILAAFLRFTLGTMNVSTPLCDTFVGRLLVSGHPLEVRAVSEDGPIKAKWMADDEFTQEGISNFRFSSDLFLARVWWGRKRDSLFYIPVEVLEASGEGLEAEEFLIVASDSCNQLTQFRKPFIEAAQNHEQTIRIPVSWHRSGAKIERCDPVERWTSY